MHLLSKVAHPAHTMQPATGAGTEPCKLHCRTMASMAAEASGRLLPLHLGHSSNSSADFQLDLEPSAASSDGPPKAEHDRLLVGLQVHRLKFLNVQRLPHLKSLGQSGGYGQDAWALSLMGLASLPRPLRLLLELSECCIRVWAPECRRPHMAARLEAHTHAASQAQ